MPEYRASRNNRVYIGKSRNDGVSETMQVLDSITIRAVHLSFPPTGSSASEGGDGLKLPAAASDL